MKSKKLNSKNKNKESVEQAAERLAEIFIMQIEWNRKNREKKIHADKEI
ncbi:MAG: hypothetical protein HQ538_03770 [Parcubacteria group bacterium]|nr:hypothetical protein [Parcubacteria group bacterium]